MPKKMMKQKSILSIFFITTILWVGSTSLASKAAQAEVAFNPPGGSAPVGRGGASRNLLCSSNPVKFSLHFMTLTPVSSNYGLTTAEHPTFFVNIPSSSAKNVFFNLIDEAGETHYQSTMPIVSEGGVMRISLPKAAPPLVVGKRYRWGVAALCSDKLEPGSPTINSWVQRVEPSAQLAHQIAQATPLDRAALYGSNGIWYDTLTTIADIRQQQPGNATLVSTWSKLLNSVGLNEVASQPLH